MQTFRLGDAARCILLNEPRGPNLAGAGGSPSGARLLRNRSLWQQLLGQRRRRVTLHWWDGIHLGGLASARASAGGRIWEMDHLYLPLDRDPLRDNGQLSAPGSAALELLERLIQGCAAGSAQRILLRVPAGSSVITVARRAGFFPCATESLLEGRARLHPAVPASQPSWRERTPQDDYPLFQLFSAATPSPVRLALGLTFDQWREARQLRGDGQREWVTESHGRIAGWCGLWARARVAEGEVMVHPDHPELLASALALALARGGNQRWLVPDYQQPVSELLGYRGLRETACYALLVKSVAVVVSAHGMAPVEA